MLLCIANRIGPRATPQVFSGTMTAAPKERVYRVDGLMPVPVMPDPIGAGPALAGPSCLAEESRRRRHALKVQPPLVPAPASAIRIMHKGTSQYLELRMTKAATTTKRV